MSKLAVNLTNAVNEALRWVEEKEVLTILKSMSDEIEQIIVEVKSKEKEAQNAEQKDL